MGFWLDILIDSVLIVAWFFGLSLLVWGVGFEILRKQGFGLNLLSYNWLVAILGIIIFLCATYLWVKRKEKQKEY